MEPLGRIVSDSQISDLFHLSLHPGCIIERTNNKPAGNWLKDYTLQSYKLIIVMTGINDFFDNDQSLDDLRAQLQEFMSTLKKNQGH